jgi:conserved hypothetical protein
MRSLLVCSTLLLFASVAYAAGSYQRTRDGKTLVWNDSPQPGEEATWSGKRDKNGFATGLGTLTWYKVEPTIVTGSNIPDARRYANVINWYSGKMVHGKLEGGVTYVDADGKRLPATFVNGSSVGESVAAQSPSPGKKAILAPTPAVTARTTAEQTAIPTPQQTAMPTPERTPALATRTPMPVPEQSPSSAAQETPTGVPLERANVASEQTVTPTSEQKAGQPDAQNPIIPTPTPPEDSLRSPTASPSAFPEQSVAAASRKTHTPSTPAQLPSPTPGAALDVHTVAALDAVYQAAVQTNDSAVMDRILADDFVLVTGRGTSLTKADLIKEAREQRTTYEHQEEEEGTQKVRVWGDTAVVTALLRVKGNRDQHPLDYKVWISDTYVRTPTGWRCVFGQVSIPLPKPDAE